MSGLVLHSMDRMGTPSGRVGISYTMGAPVLPYATLVEQNVLRPEPPQYYTHQAQSEQRGSNHSIQGYTQTPSRPFANGTNENTRLGTPSSTVFNRSMSWVPTSSFQTVGAERIATPVIGGGQGALRKSGTWGPQTQQWQIVPSSNTNNAGLSGSLGLVRPPVFGVPAGPSNWRPAPSTGVDMITISEDSNVTEGIQLTPRGSRRGPSARLNPGLGLGGLGGLGGLAMVREQESISQEGPSFSSPRKQLSMRSLSSVSEGVSSSEQREFTRMHQPLDPLHSGLDSSRTSSYNRENRIGTPMVRERTPGGEASMLGRSLGRTSSVGLGSSHGRPPVFGEFDPLHSAGLARTSSLGSSHGRPVFETERVGSSQARELLLPDWLRRGGEEEDKGKAQSGRETLQVAEIQSFEPAPFERSTSSVRSQSENVPLWLQHSDNQPQQQQPAAPAPSNDESLQPSWLAPNKEVSGSSYGGEHVGTAARLSAGARLDDTTASRVRTGRREGMSTGLFEGLIYGGPDDKGTSNVLFC